MNFIKRFTGRPHLMRRLKSSGTVLTRSRFVRNVLTVASGTAVAQAIAMALSPVITRLYGPEAFGQLGVFTSTVSLFAPAAALTLPIAIVLPERDGEAKQLVKLSMGVALVFSILVALLLWRFEAPIVRALELDLIAPFLFLVPLVVLFSAGQQVSQQWLIRKRSFTSIARVNVLQAVAVNGTQAVAGLFQPAGPVLIWVMSLGRLLHAGLLSLAALRPSHSIDTYTEPRGDTESLGEVAWRYRDFPLFRAPEVLINAASQSLPVIMLAAFFGPGIAGFYTICRTVLSLPSRLIGTSVGDVFYPRIAEAAARGENLTRLIIRATLLLAMVGVFPYLLVVAFGPYLFSVVFGGEWVTAGEFARWLALWLFFGLINGPSVRAIPVLSAQGFHLVFSLVTIALRLGALLAGYYVFDSALVSVALFSVTGLVANLALILIVIWIGHRFDTRDKDNLER